MAQEVSGSEKTLLAAIKDGEVPEPQLMRWNAWQRWRSELGRRPTSAVDGYTTSAAQESALWKAVMAELHGPDWAVSLASADGGGTAVSEQSFGTAPAFEPRVLPAEAASASAIAAVEAATAAAAEVPIEDSPGSCAAILPATWAVRLC